MPQVKFSRSRVVTETFAVDFEFIPRTDEAEVDFQKMADAITSERKFMTMLPKGSAVLVSNVKLTSEEAEQLASDYHKAQVEGTVSADKIV